ncbi:MAG: hypothetical protein JWP91_1843 [Fibrobacteres bacterium]|nr:hypothetical protein [Fibrobacterota bacterium]
MLLSHARAARNTARPRPFVPATRFPARIPIAIAVSTLAAAFACATASVRDPFTIRLESIAIHADRNAEGTGTETSSVTVTAAETEVPAWVVLTDDAGKTIAEAQPGPGSRELEFRNLECGVYYLDLRGAEGRQITRVNLF